MSWLFAIGLALAALGMMAAAFRLPPRTWTTLGAALAAGLAGYGAQASPDQPGAPPSRAEVTDKAGSGLVDVRKRLSGNLRTSNYLIVSDAFTRRGDYANAAEVLRGAVRKNPDDAEAWLAMANDLAAHADGNLTPAARYAYRRASSADPDGPGPEFFMGVAMLRQGDLVDAHQLWSRALAKAPDDAPWRGDLIARLAELERVMRAIAGQTR